MSRVRIGGSRAVVTGAGSGIGQATALRLARGGAEVVCVDINADSAAATAALCEGEAVSLTCDVSDSAAVVELAQRVEIDHGPVDILVNNAGVGVGGSFLDTEVQDWDWLIGINLNGVAYGSHAFGRAMVERGHGHVVNVASAAAYLMSRDMASYCASKAGVLAFSKCLRADWASAGVGVSAICPGVINTPIARNSRMVGKLAGQQDRFVKAFRLGHSPDLVAKAITRAVERNLEVMPVGVESALAYRVLPFVPGAVQSLAARAPVHKLASDR